MLPLSNSKSHLHRRHMRIDYTTLPSQRLVLHGRTYVILVSVIRYYTTHTVVVGYCYPESTTIKLLNQSSRLSLSPLLATKCVRLSIKLMKMPNGQRVATD